MFFCIFRFSQHGLNPACRPASCKSFVLEFFCQKSGGDSFFPMYVVQGQHGLRVVEVCAFAATNLLSLRGMPCRCSPFVSMFLCGALLPKRGVPSSEHHSVHHLGRKAALQCNVWTTSIHRVIRTDPVHYVSLGVLIHIYCFFCWKLSAGVPKRGCHFGPPFLVLCIVFLPFRTQKGVHFGPPFWRPSGPILESQGGVQDPRCWKLYIGMSQTARILTKSCMDSRGLHKAASIHNAQALILYDVPKVKTSETHVTWQQCP